MQTESSKKRVNKFDVVAELVLHTDIANNLFDATWKRGNIGLVQFCSVVGKVYNASKLDDPYADWYLMKIFDAVYNATDEIKKIKESLTEIIKNRENINLRCFGNKPRQKSFFHIYRNVANNMPFSFVAILHDLKKQIKIKIV